MLLALLVHQAESGIAERQETVIVCIQTAAVAGESRDKQLQLVIGSLADMDAYTTESILNMVGAFLNVFMTSSVLADMDISYATTRLA